jgi:hypothetical protein
LIPVTDRTSTHNILVQTGYKLIDDAWSEHGRRTYDHNDDATREFIASLAKVLQSAGWETHPNTLRAFRHPVSAEVIELEAGGSETTGHFIHHMKAFD